MIQIARTLRVVTGGLAAGAIGVTVFAGATASADPLLPAPSPTPAVPAPAAAPQNITAAPGQAPTNRLLAAPPAANPFVPNSATAATPPGVPAPAAVAPMPPTLTPTVSGTIREYLQAKGVKFEAQKPQGFKPLDITLPVPTRWTQVPDPNVPDAFAVIADRHGNSIYSSNAQVVVYKLVGNFDPKDAMEHGYVDSQKLLAWETTNASMADFGGFPSSIIEGTYRDGDITLNTSRRNVIATSGHDKYLVSLAVTTDRAVAVGDAPATDAIINGFRVATPGAATLSPAQAPGTAPVGLPAQSPAAAPVGVPAQAPATAPVPAQAPAAAPVGVPAQAPAMAPAGVPATAPVPAQAPVGVPAQPPTAAPVGVPAQAPVMGPGGLPAQTPVPSQLAAAQPRPAPNLLALVPGLPPLPNFAFLQGR
ncbi:MAG TPA: LpqN/LpqT family lipoprotein [Mycobacterium sp.]|nr:LpqN/LpqT family lipoprotein [Mycobacterium sp.]